MENEKEENMCSIAQSNLIYKYKVEKMLLKISRW